MTARAAALVVALALGACADPAPDRRAPAQATSAPVLAARADAPDAPNAMSAELAFVRDGKPVRALTRAALEAAIPPETWTALDPYYNKPKTYRALPLAAVLERGFGAPAAELARHDFVLRAKDGYTVPLPGAKLFEKGGYIAVADVEVPGWEPIGQGRANPGPYYLVWRETAQQSLDTHPRPWQLATIEIAPFEATFPHTAPAGLPASSPAMQGFRLFRDRCISCHAVNREGGRVGPDLNVPQSIVEYRPKPQIRAYIKDPRTFRYSNMPAHPGFGDADLDALVAYFEAMKDRKHDPDAAGTGGH
ncbi:Cytochrome c family protein [Minicystis rosea]|nr:Cytochrome c family protein [Minicystis rosea]